MKVNMRRKAETISDLMPKNEAVIEKVILLDKDDFDEFANDLLEDRDFIKENIDDMYADNNNVDHCILITYDGSDYGILVQSEGYHYARYSAYLEINDDTDFSNVVKYPKNEYHNGDTPF